MIAVAYWTLTAILIGLGILGAASIGLLILPIGVVLAVLGPVRSRKTVFWPVIVATLGFLVGFILVSPLRCTTSATTTANGKNQQATTHCSNLLGIDYSGTGLYNPSSTPAFIAGAGLGVVAGAAVLIFIRTRQSSQ